ncbi:MAG: radical SAM protein [Dehalococcoidales bacterium]|nr:radical SAM protein [Dehalococcoidales bacterium]
MISISRLLCDVVEPGDALRYGTEGYNRFETTHSKEDAPRPIVVWNCTRQCNLHCVHCYSNAVSHSSPEAMNIQEGKAFIRDLADFGVPVLLFSGGEPLLRDDIFKLANFAREQGITPVLSTNGTLITEKVAQKIRSVGFGEVGISLDGIGENNDRFRGEKGAYQAALEGIRNCVALEMRVSLRLTITAFNYRQIPAIFDLVEREGIARVCLYHLVYAGRASNLHNDDLNHSETRLLVDLICERTLDAYRRGKPKEVLTVANHADGVYIYLKLKEKDPERAVKVLSLLRRNGGNNSGIKIGAVDDLGNVHPDQFWWHYSLGNVRRRKFSDIWADTSEPLMRGLRNRKGLLKGRCGQCHHLDLCNGNLRVRAEAVFGDVWAEDPACYLTNQEIGLS